MDRVNEQLVVGAGELGPVSAEVCPEAEPIRVAVDQVRGHTRRLRVLSSDYLASNSNKARDLYDGRCRDISSLTAEVKRSIEAMDAKTQEQARKRLLSGADIRVRRQFALRLTEKLMYLTHEAQRVKFEHEKAVEGQTVTRVKVRHTDNSGKVHIDDAGAQTMARQLVKSRRERHMFMQAQAELEDALGQHEDILDLQRAVLDLAAIVQDLHLLATAQQRNLQESAVNAEDALQRTEVGNANLRSAKKAQQMCVVS